MARPKKGELAPIADRWVLINIEHEPYLVGTFAMANYDAREIKKNSQYAWLHPLSGTCLVFEVDYNGIKYDHFDDREVLLFNRGGYARRCEWIIVNQVRVLRGHYVLFSLRAGHVVRAIEVL